jgi:hypothetical protein
VVSSAAFADLKPEGQTPAQIASFAVPEGERTAHVAAYPGPEGLTQAQIALYRVLILSTLFKSVLAAGLVLGLISAFLAALMKFGPVMYCTWFGSPN